MCIRDRIKDQAQAQRVQLRAVGLTGELAGRDAAPDLAPLDMLALVGFVTAQLPEVGAADVYKRQILGILWKVFLVVIIMHLVCIFLQFLSLIHI